MSLRHARAMHGQIDRTVGFVVLLVAVGLMWYALGFWVTVLFSLWMLFLRWLLLYLVAKESRLARAGAVLLMPSVIFLFFLPKRIQNRIEDLRNRERQKP